jgi:hypothetical protein
MKGRDMFTDELIRERVIPAIESTGGAIVLASPYGMPLQLLTMDQFQPKTWIVGMGFVPQNSIWDDYGNFNAVADNLRSVSNRVLENYPARNSWSAIGYWINLETGLLEVEPVETFTSHYMAVDAAKRRNQACIYLMPHREHELMLAS